MTMCETKDLGAFRTSAVGGKGRALLAATQAAQVLRPRRLRTAGLDVIAHGVVGVPAGRELNAKPAQRTERQPDRQLALLHQRRGRQHVRPLSCRLASVGGTVVQAIVLATFVTPERQEVPELARSAGSTNMIKFCHFFDKAQTNTL